MIGTRAQLVKMAPLVIAAKDADVAIEILVTSQHHDAMSDLAGDLGIGEVFPNFDRGVERSSITALVRWLPSALWRTWRELRVIRARNPRAVVLVHGDTLSTLIGAVAGRVAGLTVAHVESGLTSHALFDPFPEELTRRLVFRLSHIAFCPDAGSTARMARIRGIRAVDTQGNTILDALRYAVDQTTSSTTDARYGVVSVHRFENIMDLRRLRRVVKDIIEISKNLPLKIVLHPATERRLRAVGLWSDLKGTQQVVMVPRMIYSRFMRLAAGAEVIITDGGSNQEELAILGIPTIILRTRTERPDGLGQNAILEGRLPYPLVEYIDQKHHLDLRRPSRLDCSVSPSRLIIRWLCQHGPSAPGPVK